jgi:hypothetical protein
MKEFSEIQNQIIARLKNADTLRYGQIKPEGSDNDLYNYHLQQLVKKGFIDRSDEGYGLSDSGKKLVADANLLSGNPASHHLFKINVLTVLSRVVDGEIQVLQQLRKSQPSYGKIGVPGGVVRKGEWIVDSAKRKLETETGLVADFRLLGNERRMLYKNSELFSDLIFPIAYADHHEGELIKETEYGEHMWNSIDEAILNESGRHDSIQSLLPVLQAIKSGEINQLPAFFNEFTQTDKD